MSLNRFIIAIPARLESKRLPNKLIADIEGKTMLERVIENCLKVDSNAKVVLCTDNLKLKKIADNLNIRTLITSKSCESGSHRISTVINSLIKTTWDLPLDNDLQVKEDLFNKTVVINVQADQPFINPNIIKEMINFFNNAKGETKVLTPVYRLKNELIHNPNVVKTLLNKKNEAIYFSRTALPYVRDLEEHKWGEFFNYWGHAGIYGYRADILSFWQKLTISPLEKAEKLEQLRLIDNDISISTFEIKEESLSVDTSEQLQYAREIARKLKV